MFSRGFVIGSAQAPPGGDGGAKVCVCSLWFLQNLGQGPLGPRGGWSFSRGSVILMTCLFAGEDGRERDQKKKRRRRRGDSSVTAGWTRTTFGFAFNLDARSKVTTLRYICSLEQRFGMQ